MSELATYLDEFVDWLLNKECLVHHSFEDAFDYMYSPACDRVYSNDCFFSDVLSNACDELEIRLSSQDEARRVYIFAQRYAIDRLNECRLERALNN